MSVSSKETTLLFRDASANELVSTLERLGASRKFADGWVWTISDLEIFVIHDIDDWEIDLTGDVYIEWWQPIKHALGSEPTAAMIISSDAGEGAEERCAVLVREILGTHSGVAEHKPQGDHEVLRHRLIAYLEAAARAHDAGFFFAIPEGYDRLEAEVSRRPSPDFDTLKTALAFWDGWIDARNHDWRHYPGIKAGDWPRLARGIIDDLRQGRDIGDKRVLARFDFRRPRTRPSLWTRLRGFAEWR